MICNVISWSWIFVWKTHFSLSSVTNNSSPLWSRLPSSSRISSKPFVKRFLVMILTKNTPNDVGPYCHECHPLFRSEIFHTYAPWPIVQCSSNSGLWDLLSQPFAIDQGFLLPSLCRIEGQKSFPLFFLIQPLKILSGYCRPLTKCSSL